MAKQRLSEKVRDLKTITSNKCMKLIIEAYDKGSDHADPDAFFETIEQVIYKFQDSMDAKANR